jgi:hypothetical protein
MRFTETLARVPTVLNIGCKPILTGGAVFNLEAVNGFTDGRTQGYKNTALAG